MINATVSSPVNVTIETKSYTVFARNLPYIKEQVELNNRKARKLGLPVYTLTVSEPRKEVMKGYLFEGDQHERSINAWVRDIEVTGPTKIAYDGWTFVGMIEHHSGGNMLFGFEGIDTGPWTHAESSCDHCRSNRIRSATLIVRHDDGRTMQLGKSCVEKYLQGCGSFTILERATFVLNAEIHVQGEPGEGGGGGGVDYVSTLRVGSIAVELMLKEGYKKEMGEGESTKGKVFSFLFNKAARQKMIDQGFEVSEEAIAIASEAIEQFGDLPDEQVRTDSFLNNVRTIVRDHYVKMSHAGILIGALWGKVRDRYTKPVKIESDHVGTVKERRDFSVTVTNIYEFESFYGMTRIVKMTEGSNVLVWKTSSDPKMKAGDTITITGTVKEHGEYRGVKQTEIQRVKVKA